MFTKVRTATVVGVEGYGVDVEIDFSRRTLPNFKIVGLPHKSVAEAKERVRSALRNAGFTIPAARVTVNLAPSDSPKKGAHFDLPIAVGLLVSAGLISPSAIDNIMCVGELSLEGSVSPIPGVVSIALYAKREGIRALYIPYGNMYDVSTLSDCPIVPIRTLSDIVYHLRNPKALSDRHMTSWSDTLEEENHVLLPIKGQAEARRALEIALAGGHHMYIKGPPGVGKTLLARTTPHILPPLTRDEFIEVLTIRSATHISDSVSMQRPFVSPPITMTERDLLGGGSGCVVGEVTKAHKGVLYLDELPLFKRSVIDALRRPLDDGYVTHNYAHMSVQSPAQCILIATSNACPCGYLGHPRKTCTCSQQAIAGYLAKVSGPLRDRLDIHVCMQDVDSGELADEKPISLTAVKKRVVEARHVQNDRNSKATNLLNAQLTSELIETLCPMTPDAKKFLVSAYKKLDISARAYFSIIKVSRTIADLQGTSDICEEHVAEALYYRE